MACGTAAAATSKGSTIWNVLPVARLALDPDASAHQLDQRGGDRQAEPGAAEPARGRAVGLRERLEDRARFSARNADAGVAHREAQPRRGRRSARFSRDRDSDTSPRSVNLTALPTRLSQHLPQAAGSPTTAGGHRRRDLAEQLEPFCCAWQRQRLARVSPSTSASENGDRARAPACRASILEKSRMSLMHGSSDSAEP